MQPVPASFYNKTQAARKIIVVDLGFLGDSVHLVPALREIKRHYPAAELHTLSAPVGAEVLRLASCVDRAWEFPLGPPSPPWWRHWEIIRALRRERFDLAFNFSGADRTLFLTALTGAIRRVACSGARRHFWNNWLIPDWMPRQNRKLPVFEQRREALAACGFNLQPAQFDLHIPETDRDWAAQTIPAGAIHLSINASTPLKEWPLRHWIELVKNLLRQHPTLKLAATGSARAREQERLQALAEAVNDNKLKLELQTGPRLQLIPPPLSIAQLAALLERCRLHIGADSGVLHLAMALGRPTLTLFRDYAGTAEWLPPGPQHRHLIAACECADNKNPPCAAQTEAACLGRISPEEVLQAAIQPFQG